MAHEIQRNDNLVLVQKPAWHGLGLVVPDHLTPTEAVKMVFPWTVDQAPIFRFWRGERLTVDGHMLNVRSDDGSQLGIVSDMYRVFQPQDMADFADALVDEGGVRVETAGSIRGGKRIWLLLKGEEFSVANGDQIFPYMLLSNGYDGLTTLRGTPTTVRAVCSNTLHATIPNYDTGALGNAAFVIRHTVNLMDRVEAAKAALKGYAVAIEETKKFFNTLAGKPVTSDEVKEFFLACYTSDFGEIPENPKDGFQERRREKAMSAFNSFSKRFDDERAIAGATAWNMLNAYSGLVQHDRKARGKDDADRIEKRVDQNLFGLNQERTQAAAARAFRVALAS